MDLRRFADAGPLPLPDPDAGDPGASGQCRITLAEPSELPICLLHVGADAEVLGGLDAGARPLPVLVAASDGEDSGAAGLLDVGLDSGTDAGMGAANSPLAAESGGANNFDDLDGLALSEYFEDTLDPAATVRALSDTALCRLADALYRHLDTASPYVRGAHLVRARGRRDPEPPSGGLRRPGGGRSGAGHGLGLSRCAVRLSL